MRVRRRQSGRACQPYIHFTLISPTTLLLFNSDTCHAFSEGPTPPHPTPSLHPSNSKSHLHLPPLFKLPLRILMHPRFSFLFPHSQLPTLNSFLFIYVTNGKMNCKSQCLIRYPNLGWEKDGCMEKATYGWVEIAVVVFVVVVVV